MEAGELGAATSTGAQGTASSWSPLQEQDCPAAAVSPGGGRSTQHTPRCSSHAVTAGATSAPPGWVAQTCRALLAATGGLL